MLKNLCILIGLVTLSNPVLAGSRIIYGEDSRIDMKHVFDKRIKKISQAVAARVYNLRFNTLATTEDFVRFENILNLSHPRSAAVCSDERFATQPTISDCTGFLVSDRHLVTAGHCVVRPREVVMNQETFSCSSHSWAFDYSMNVSGKPLNLKKFKSENIYGCKQVVFGTWQEKDDYAVIELDRPVKGRTPLKMNKKSKVKPGTELFIIGHPSGLPLKYAEGSRVFELENNYFTTNLDSFAGNSGSPVFNKETLEVEGILVRGDTDYKEEILDDGSMCFRVNTCDNSRENCERDDPGIHGEHVSYIEKVLGHL